MAANQYYDPQTQAYLNTSWGNNNTGGSFASDPMMNTANNQAAAGWNKYERQQDIEWANPQRMTDPNYWAQAFNSSSGGGGGTLANLANIEQSPSYKWRFEQGREALNRTAAARGMLGSGNRLVDLMKYGQGMASQEYDAEFQRQLAAKKLENDIRAQNMQMSLAAMEQSSKYQAPRSYNTPGGIVTRWD
jgi:hypothetical protein